jgi:hypothetical protein
MLERWFSTVVAAGRLRYGDSLRRSLRAYDLGTDVGSSDIQEEGDKFVDGGFSNSDSLYQGNEKS